MLIKLKKYVHLVSRYTEEPLDVNYSTFAPSADETQCRVERKEPLDVNYSNFAPSADETQCRVERKY